MPKPAYLDFQLAQDSVCVITDDGSNLTIQLAQVLRQKQWQIVVLSFPESIIARTVRFPEELPRVILQNMGEEHLKEQLAAIAKNHGAIAGLIHLYPSPTTLESDQAIVKQIFLTAKYLKSYLNEAAENPYSCFITVSQIDGELGTSQSPHNPTSPSLHPLSSGLLGLTKSLNLEWEQVFCRALDFAPKLDNQTKVQSILGELHDPNRLIVEVGYSSQGRMTLVTEADSNENYEKIETLNKNSVLLVSGGARGITAECVIKLAKYFQCKFILLGRSSMNAEPEWAKAYQTEIDLKRQAITYFIAQETKLKPIQINQLVKQILAQREIEGTLQKITQAGGKAEYLSVNITNKLRLQEKLAAVTNKFGQITGIIHGAGVLADKLIEKKSAQDFDKVYAPKVIGLQNILSCVQPSQLRHLILFSSVAGFYGNIGQTDYAIANEILNKFAYNFPQKYSQCQAIAINWGPWDGGMVTPEIKRIFEQRNIDLIPIQLGAEILVNELTRNDHNRTQVLVGSSLVRDACRLTSELKTYYIKRTLTLKDNSFLKDHAIDGKPVFPMACAIEWVIKTCEQFYPGYKRFVLNNFKVLKGIIFDGNEAREYTFKIQEKQKKDRESVELNITVFRKLENNKNIYHYSGEVILLSKIPVAPVYQSFKNRQEQKTINILPYQDGTLFHQGIFQGITKVLNISPNKITLECISSLRSQKLENSLGVKYDNSDLMDLTIQSVLADIIMQSGLIWLQHFHQVAALPSRTGKVEFFRDFPVNQIFYVSTEILSCKNNKLVANIISHDNQGLIYCQAFNVEATISKSLKKMFVSRHNNQKNNSPQKSILFDQKQINELCTGSISKCFGSEYAIYDQGIKSSRLPNTELNLINRVIEIQGKRHQFTKGSKIKTEYDVSASPWYYKQNSSVITPYSILMELGLQPCGFLSAYLGTTLIYPTEDLYFRNLDGQGELIKNIDIRGKTITNIATLLTSTVIQGMILQRFIFELYCDKKVFYQGTATFGHFSPQALAKQVGLDMGQYVNPWYTNHNYQNFPVIDINLQTKKSRTKYYQMNTDKPHYCLSEKLLDLIHGVKIIRDGGEFQQGYIYAYRNVQPSDWYFRCHFFQDPVMPGSLGVEAILQAMQVYALHLDLGKHFRSPSFTHLVQHQTIWKYRGQIPQPSQSQKIYLEIHLTKVEVTQQRVIIMGNASLWKPNMRIYEVKDIGICITESEEINEKNKYNSTSNLLRISKLQINNYPINYDFIR